MTGYVGPIEKLTEKNTRFRQVVFTGKYEQLVVMCLEKGEEIGNEVHPQTDQFFRIEEGEAKFVFNGSEEHIVRAGEAVIVPAGTYHNVINVSVTGQLKLYTVYAPPNHPDGTIHKTKADADAAEAAEHKSEAPAAEKKAKKPAAEKKAKPEPKKAAAGGKDKSEKKKPAKK